jgi:DNA-binding CsgD family transcriptional regulator
MGQLENYSSPFWNDLQNITTYQSETLGYIIVDLLHDRSGIAANTVSDAGLNEVNNSFIGQKFGSIERILPAIYDIDSTEIDWRTIFGHLREVEPRIESYIYRWDEAKGELDEVLHSEDRRHTSMQTRPGYADSGSLAHLRRSDMARNFGETLLREAHSASLKTLMAASGFRRALVAQLGQHGPHHYHFALKLRNDDLDTVRQASFMMRFFTPHFRRALKLKARLQAGDSRQHYLSDSFAFEWEQDNLLSSSAAGLAVSFVGYEADRLRFLDRSGREFASVPCSRQRLRDARRGGGDCTFPIVNGGGRFVAGDLRASADDETFQLIVVDTQCRPPWFENYFGPRGLASSEYNVLAAYCLGFSIRSIAEIRGRSPETVKRQLKNAMGKIGVTKQEDAVRIFYRLMMRDPQLDFQSRD